MVLISVMYPGGEDATFDSAYYVERHIPLVKGRWTAMGLDNVQLVKALATPDGSAPRFAVIALLTFRSLEAFQGAAQAHGGEIFADIPKFTNVKPVVQINEPLA
jgi:uncharacterized protein (TIGR02118 family)